MATSPRSKAPYLFANILKFSQSSSLNAIIIGMTISYVVSAFHGNSRLSMRSSSNVNSKSGLDDTISDQN